MTVTTLTWDKVTAKFKDGRVLSYKRAQVSFNAENQTLTIFQPGSENQQKHLLLARAELRSLTPWEMKFKAYWWSSENEEFCGPDDEALITCEF